MTAANHRSAYSRQSCICRTILKLLIGSCTPPPEPCAAALAQGLECDVQQRDDENADCTRSDHSRENRRANIVPTDLGGPMGDNQRINSENEGARGHHHGSKPHLRAEHSGFIDILALLALVLGEFNDQYPVLRRHREDHHKSNLSVKIEREMKSHNSEKRS